jgi:hypothetical protein
VDWINLRAVRACCEHGNELSGSIRGKKFRN